MTALLLTLALVGQNPPPPLPLPRAQVQPQLQPQSAPSRRQAELAATLAKRKAAAAARGRVRVAKAQAEYQERRAQEAYVAKMAPVWAQQQKDAANLMLRQQSANAMTRIAGATETEALTDRARLRLQQSQAGVPFIPTPNGMQPYPFSVGSGP
jgi:type IV secretory pathway VirB10-like protein